MDAESRTTAVADTPVKTTELTVNESRTYKFIKRAFDVVASAVGLVLCVPVFLTAGIAIKLEDPKGPVFYHQPRIGLHGKEFTFYKLRSMRVDAEEVLDQLSKAEKEEFSQNFKLKNDPRITKVGRFIRKTSIDELPQLLNVLNGDMSLVGPRPPLLVEKEAYGEHLAKVMSVRPGITGYWQVQGRSEISFDERISMNEYYIDHRSLGLDIKILLKTVGAVLRGGVHTEGHIYRRQRRRRLAAAFFKTALCAPLLLAVPAAETGESTGIKAEPAPAAAPQKTAAGTGYRFIKRAFDVVAAMLLSVLLLLPMAVIAILIMVKDHGSPFYKHRRIGKDGREISVLKFRTMRRGADDLENMLTPEQLEEYKQEFKLKDDPRLIGYKQPGDGERCFGEILRKTSLDELPQITYNVLLKGDMSFVGPRPVLREELEKYYTPAEQAALLSAKPGITGYWQTHGRSDCTYESGERQKLELYYVQNQSLTLDMKILIKTISVVVHRGGTY